MELDPTTFTLKYQGFDHKVHALIYRPKADMTPQEAAVIGIFMGWFMSYRNSSIAHEDFSLWSVIQRHFEEG